MPNGVVTGIQLPLLHLAILTSLSNILMFANDPQLGAQREAIVQKNGQTKGFQFSCDHVAEQAFMK